MQSLPRKWLACSAFLLAWIPVWAHASLVPFHFGEKLLQQMEQQFGAGAGQRLLDWKAFMADAQTLSEAQRVQAVNEYVNRMPFVSDQQHWGRNDYWATPFEFFASNGGDCEDFAIAKYYTLVSLGVDERRLRLTYVKAGSDQEGHMVLTYQPQWSDDASAWVLDNLAAQVDSLRARTDLTPVYSFNRGGFWLVQQNGSVQLAGRGQDVVMWNEVDSRLQAEALL
ncbi:MAG TPA: transglutaminase-like cysteine peptidase [Pseudomonadales bacterium]|nr:transglutaminase-like cysteine peptidase [Pseudomonadales bacterium]